MGQGVYGKVKEFENLGKSRGKFQKFKVVGGKVKEFLCSIFLQYLDHCCK